MQVAAKNGFSLIELIIIIAILGILAVVLTPRLPTELVVQFEARRLLNDIRYTQLLSMSTGIRYRWVRISSNSYRILNQTGNAIMLPGGSNTQTLNNTSINTSNLPNSLIAFNSLGVPYVDASLPGTTLNSVASISLSGNNQSRTIQITPQTGHAL